MSSFLEKEPRLNQSLSPVLSFNQSVYGFPEKKTRLQHNTEDAAKNLFTCVKSPRILAQCSELWVLTLVNTEESARDLVKCEKSLVVLLYSLSD